MQRRNFLKTAAAATAGLFVPEVLAGGDAASASVTDAECLWGAYASPRRGISPTEAFASLENKIGRKLAVTRHYHPFDSILPGDVIRWSASGGRRPYISFKARHANGVPIRWAAIANGRYDRFLRGQARRLKAWDRPAFICFHHEPEDDPDCGTAQDFIRAHERVRNIFYSERARKLTWIVTLMASTYAGGNGGAHRWLPHEYRWLGVDGYNRYPCVDERQKHPWKPFYEIFGPARHLAKSLGRCLFIGEVGCVEQNDCGYRLGDPLAKARWLTNMGTTLARWPEVKAVVYTSAATRHNGYPMDYQVTSSLPSLTAYRSVGRLGYFVR